MYVAIASLYQNRIAFFHTPMSSLTPKWPESDHAKIVIEFYEIFCLSTMWIDEIPFQLQTVDAKIFIQQHTLTPSVNYKTFFQWASGRFY